ncbi:MAG: class I SAM-dependent methyltransferase [Ignavibacteriaceae bacterium]
MLKTENEILKIKKSKIYNEVSSIYNYLMKNVDYKFWSDYLYSITKDFVRDNPKVLELAAGNCNFAKYFIKKYPNILLTDISFRMLQNKNLKKNRKVCCSMLNLPFNEKFDLIYSTFDSVNYILQTEDLQNFFIQINSYLTNDGVFAFDVSLEKNSFNHVRNSHKKSFYNGIRFNQNSEYDSKTRIHKNCFEIIRNEKIFTEIHKQKIYPFETYFEVIDSSGLYVVYCYEAFTFKNGSNDSDRVQFILKKNKQHANYQ